MLYVRVSSLSSVMVQLPGSRDVWTSSFNAVKRVPSCSVTAFSIGSCWPAVWVASPGRVNITESFSTLAWQRCISSSCPLWTLTINLTWAPVWKGFLPEPDLSKSVWLFFLAISQSTSSSTLSTCDRTSSCGERLKSDDDDDDDGDYGEHTAQTDSECHWKSEASSYKNRNTTLTAALVTVFVFTMAKWDCFSTSTSWA